MHELKVTTINDNMFTFYVCNFVNILVFLGIEGVLLVDTGFLESAEQVKAKLKELGCGPVKYVVNTHVDKDHAEANPVLGKDAVILAHTTGREDLIRWKVYKNSTGLPTVTFETEVTLHFNDECIQLIPMTGGHTTQDIIVHFSGANIVYLGDIVVSDSFPLVKVDYGARISRLLEILDSIIQRFPDNTRFLVSHGRELTVEDLKVYREMVTRTVEIVTSAARVGKSPGELKKENILKDWEAWNSKDYEMLNADLWIETICKDLDKNS